jgi:pimeloyl-ACP methyl ester carboxylesterase
VAGARWLRPFVAGVVTGGAAFAIARAATSRRHVLDHRLIPFPGSRDDVPPVVVVPGIMGSGLLRPDGTRVWLNVRNAVGQYKLSLPLALPLSECRDDLTPGSLLGTDEIVPRLFGFTEYYDLIEMLSAVGFRPASADSADGMVQHVFAYDWRRDLVSSARRLEETLDALADARGDPALRVNVVGHSMGGLIARYYLRYGTAEPAPGASVTWAGARRIANLMLVGVPNAGGIHSLEALLHGNRVGLSYATLATSVVARMPSVYQLLPPAGAATLVDHEAEILDSDLHDVETWKRFGWGPYGPAGKRLVALDDGRDTVSHEAFLEAALLRARDFHAALARKPDTPCPSKVVVFGGDCLPTLARGLVPEKPGPARFEPLNRKEAETMFEAGDGRVTRASVLGAHLPDAEHSETGSGYPEVAHAFFGHADHHGIYNEATFQSALLRRLLRPATLPPRVESRGEVERG